MQVRFIHCSQNVNSSKTQLGKIVNKVMNSHRTKKQQNKKSPESLMISKTFGNNTSKISTDTHRSRRVTVLNKIFMKYVTDLMTTGEIAPKLLGRGVEITHVKVAPDYQVVNVFWYSSDKENANDNTEKILKESAGHLQHELSQLRLIGIVPPIQFVKNKHFGLVKEVENRLSKVDFGEDYIPSAYIVDNNNVSTLQTSLSDKVKNQLFALSSNNLQQNDFCEINIPEMRQDVMGFNHSSIMKKITQSLHKIKNPEKNKEYPRSDISTSQSTVSQIDSFLSTKQENEMFDEFLKKKSIQEKQKHKSVSQLQAKHEDENEWDASITNEYVDEEINIDEEYKDEYYEIEKYK